MTDHLAWLLLIAMLFGAAVVQEAGTFWGECEGCSREACVVAKHVCRINTCFAWKVPSREAIEIALSDEPSQYPTAFFLLSDADMERDLWFVRGKEPIAVFECSVGKLSAFE